MFATKLVPVRILARRLATSPTMPDIKTFVFLDLETTGLPQLDNNTTKITELSAIAVEAEHISLGCFPFPRVANKLSLCFNPSKYIHEVTEKLTGLSNELLENQSRFTANTVLAFNNFLEVNRRPICLVAHNGDKFDFPILRAEIHKTQSAMPDDILCVDSLTAFRSLDELLDAESHPTSVSNSSDRGTIPFEFNDGYDELLVKCAEEYENNELNDDEPQRKKLSLDELQQKNETTPRKSATNQTNQMENVNGAVYVSKKANGDVRPPNGTTVNSRRNLFTQRYRSYKLRDIFYRLTNKKSPLEHQAEGDVIMMITCVSVYAERFVQYANCSARKFNEVPRMRPGQPIGT